MSKPNFFKTLDPKVQEQISRTYGPSKDGLCDIGRISKGMDMINEEIARVGKTAAREMVTKISKAIDLRNRAIKDNEDKLSKLLLKYHPDISLEAISRAYICNCAACGYMNTKSKFREAYWRIFGLTDGRTNILRLVADEEQEKAEFLLNDLIQSMRYHEATLGPNEEPEWTRLLGA